MSRSCSTLGDLDTIATSNPADRDKPSRISPSIANMKAQLRTTLALAILAATLPAQANDYDQALQRAELIERQEGNLAAAEAAYTALLDDSKAPKAVHDAAYFQLAALMWRLGKRDDATKMLDVVVAAGGELGEKASALLQSGSKEAQGKLDRVARARAIIKRYAEITSVNAVADSHPLVQELRQLGEAAAQAITEELNVGPALRNNGTKLSGNGPTQLRFLFSQLWLIGTPPAQQFFNDAASTGPLPWQRFLTSGMGGVAQDLVPSLLQFTRTVDPTREVWRNATTRLTWHSDEAIAMALAADHVATREAGLVALTTRWEGMSSTAIESFLTDHSSKLKNVFASNTESLRTAKWDLLGLFAKKGQYAATMLFFDQVEKHPEEYPHTHKISAAVKADDAWIRGITKAARAVALNTSSKARRAEQALKSMLWRHEPSWTKAVVDDVATLIQLGLLRGSGSSNWLKHYVGLASTAQHIELIARFPEMHHISEAAYYLTNDHAAPELLPAVATVLAQLTDDSKIAWYTPRKATDATHYMLLLAAACDPKQCGAVIGKFAVTHPIQLNHTIGILASLSKDRDDAAARSALRELLVADTYGTDQSARELRNFILMELVRAGDVATIPLLEKAYELGVHRTHTRYSNLNPADRSRPQPSAPTAAGLALFARSNNSARPYWHGYGDNDLASAWQLLLNGAHGDAAWADLIKSNCHAPEPAIATFAQQLAKRWHQEKSDKRSPMQRQIQALARLPDDALEGNQLLRNTIASLVSDADDALAIEVFHHLPDAIAKEFAGEAVAGLQRGKNESWLSAMSGKGIALSKQDWLAALSGDRDMCIAALYGLNKNADPTLRSAVEAKLAHSDLFVRTAASTALVRMFGSDAVSSLLPLLQDRSDQLVKHVRGHLTQLREFEEQRDFWGNKNGRNISTKSSAAKLIGQAMPTEDKEQRVLAIRSLALLNAPEALPYLIDWTKDKDADVQAAAKKAIAAMHQKGATDTPKPKK